MGTGVFSCPKAPRVKINEPVIKKQKVKNDFIEGLKTGRQTQTQF